LLPPHEPYTARHDFIGLFNDGWKPVPKQSNFTSEGHSEEFLNQNRRDYDEYLAYADAEFGRIYDFLLNTGVLDSTYLIVTSDHGELFERGIRGHVTPALYQPVIRVPLLISRPGQMKREDVLSSVSSVDLVPSLLYATGQEIPNWCEGEVLPLFGNVDINQDRELFIVEAKSNPKFSSVTKGTIALVVDEKKYIHYLNGCNSGAKDEFYNLADDPDERNNLFNPEKQIAKDLKMILLKKLQSVNHL
jgi:arylsulfatase A-like enzyme